MRYMVFTTVLFISMLSQTLVFSQNVKVENRILQKALESIRPKFCNSALSCIFIRTLYSPQALHTFYRNQELEVEQTVISEILANNDGIKESTFILRKVGTYLGRKLNSHIGNKLSFVKRGTFYYSDDGHQVRLYDCKNRVGIIKKSPGITDPLENVAYPCIVSNKNKYLSRARPALLSKFNNSIILRESSHGNYIRVEGQYTNSDPERYFVLTIVPDYNYAIAWIDQYDKNRRILTSMIARDFIQIANNLNRLWLPKTTIFRQYKYDDCYGNSVQVSKLDILNPRLVNAKKDDLSFAFPTSVGQVYDQTRDIFICRNEVGSNGLFFNSSKPMVDDISLFESRCNALISRIHKKYRTAYSLENTQRGNILDEKETSALLWCDKKESKLPSFLISPKLQLPQSNVKQVLLISSLILICGATTVTIVNYMRRDKKYRTI